MVSEMSWPVPMCQQGYLKNWGKKLESINRWRRNMRDAKTNTFCPLTEILFVGQRNFLDVVVSLV